MTNQDQVDGVSRIYLSAEPVEKAILAALLEDSTLVRKISPIIDLPDFFSKAAKNIYQWVTSEFSNGSMPDATMALSSFSGSDEEAYLMEVLACIPKPGQIEQHAEHLLGLSERKRTLEAVSRTLLSVQNTDIPLDNSLSIIDSTLKTRQARIAARKSKTRTFAEVNDAWNISFKRRLAGDISALKTDYTDLDDLIVGLEKEDLVIIGGRPSMGKTTFAMNLVENIAVFRPKRAMVFSLEMPAEGLMQRSVCSIAGVDHEDLRKGTLKVGDAEKIKAAEPMIRKANIVIDDTPGLPINQLVSRAHAEHEKEELDLIMIDYLQLIKVPGNSNNRADGVGEVSRALKQLARDLKCPVVALSQLNRDLERRQDKRPMNADLRESGAIEQDADIIMFVYRDEVYNQDSQLKGIAEIIIGKQRNGPLGTAPLSLAKGQSRFSNLHPEQKSLYESAMRGFPVSSPEPSSVIPRPTKKRSLSDRITIPASDLGGSGANAFPDIFEPTQEPDF